MRPLFIYYRRSDSEAYTGRVYDRLVQHFGKEQSSRTSTPFPSASIFRTHLKTVIANCHAVIAVIGKSWLAFRRSLAVRPDPDFHHDGSSGRG
jgi:hypothetical protein